METKKYVGKVSAFLAIAAACSLALSGCGSAQDTSASSDKKADVASSSSSAPADDPGEKGFDISQIHADPQIAGLVPSDIKKTGVLLNGASTDYAPAEFRKADGTTPTGYDVDLIRAIAAVLGLKGQTKHAEFDSLIPRIGSSFNVGASSFTITGEREKQVNMISYLKVGFQFATQKGNPKHFDQKNMCGKTVGVQTGTAQQEWLEGESKKCTQNKKPAIKIMPVKEQTEVSTKVASGQYDAMVADSPVIGWVVKKTNGGVEKSGDIFETALHGIAVSKKDEQLTQAVQKALQKLMDDGTFKKILAHYGADQGAQTKAQLNPPAPQQS